MADRDIPSVPITTLAGLTSLSDRKYSTFLVSFHCETLFIVGCLMIMMAEYLYKMNQNKQIRFGHSDHRFMCFRLLCIENQTFIS